MSTEFCPECHQPMSHVVAGVRLPIFKAQLFHFIESHPGQSGHDLQLRFSKASRWTITAHVYQINEALMNTNVRIRWDRFTGYYVDKSKGSRTR